MFQNAARGVALLLACACAHAGPVYKCTDAAGAISFQATPCADGAAQTEVAIQKAPPAPPAPPPGAGLSWHDEWEAQWKKQHPVRPGSGADVLQQIVTQGGTRPAPTLAPASGSTPAPGATAAGASASRSAAPAAPAPSPNDVSYECKDGNGDVFYRHRPCPAEVLQGYNCSGAGCVDYVIVVKSSRQVSRDEACHELHRAGAGSRPLHVFDEPAPNTYDKNLGRDPCR